MLMTTEELMFVDEIDCRDLFPGNDPRERILVFESIIVNGGTEEIKRIIRKYK